MMAIMSLRREMDRWVEMVGGVEASDRTSQTLPRDQFIFQRYLTSTLQVSNLPLLLLYSLAN